MDASCKHKFDYHQRFKTPEQRFFEKVRKPSNPSECWIWISSAFKGEYGCFWFNKKRHPASRVSWILHKGNIPEGMCVLHHCDNPRCVNPDHLFLGTKADNNADKVRKGRQAKGQAMKDALPRGSNHKRSKLKEPQVIEIRRLSNEGQSYTAIAKLYGISYAMVGMIVRRDNWTHI